MTDDRFPYQVAMVSANGVYCGGSLVDKDWVLSAAHCKGGADRVYVGVHDLRDLKKGDVEIIDVWWETQHPDYDRETLDHDVMMVRLRNSSSHQTVRLDDGSADLSAGTNATVMGWGATSYGGPVSDVLLEVELDVMDNRPCDVAYDTEGRVTDSMMCAFREGYDSCQGDSGSPLVLKGENASRDVQIGIVSWGVGCAESSYPGVYARVGSSDVVDWIRQQIANGTLDETYEGNPFSELPWWEDYMNNLSWWSDDFHIQWDDDVFGWDDDDADDPDTIGDVIRDDVFGWDDDDRPDLGDDDNENDDSMEHNSLLDGVLNFIFTLLASVGLLIDAMIGSVADIVLAGRKIASD